MGQLEGAYALLVKSTHYPGEMVACKRGSPLILGLRSTLAAAAPGGGSGGGFECFLASDASAVVEHTKKCALCCGQRSGVVWYGGKAQRVTAAGAERTSLYPLTLPPPTSTAPPPCPLPPDPG